MEILEKAKKIEETSSLCYHCLGRQFAQLSFGYGNDERGEALVFALENDINFDKFDDLMEEWKKEDPNLPERNECWICDNFFDNVNDYVEKIDEKAKDLEFDGFLVGSRPTARMLEREENLWEEVGIEWTEPIKGEINREVGKRLEKKWNREANLERPEVAILIDLGEDEIKVNINSLYVYGEYDKLERWIPQTKWPDSDYETSVEEIIAVPFMKETEAEEHSFHGCGREDIDALCLAGRPFVFEVKEPKKRKIDLKKIQKEVNDEGRVKIHNIRFCDKDLVAKIKKISPDKTYRALVELDKDVDDEKLEKLKDLERTIRQKTPNRVLHRRSDLQRYREIKEIKWKKVDDKKIELEITAESGTYIKEFVSGDEMRTRPSVSEILGCDAKVSELDVLKVHFDENDVKI